ncbi:MAG TPA: type IX secretion system plug protein domain-containing protein, partial [Anditalea sp.]|nr:type IX secretion system plug protein domain-containing protein [Anditalea sp.]
MNRLLVFSLGLFLSFQAQAQFIDQVFEENIQSVRLYPKTAEFSSQFNSSVIAMNNSVPLVLEFDDLAYDADMYSAKIIHCNADWKPSPLRDADYLNQFNEFNVNDYEYAINTRIPFIHYTFQVPRLTRSGNYVLKVYRGRDENQTIITKRFMVYDGQLNVGAAVVPSSRTEDRRDGQQLNLNVNFKNRELIDPLSNVKVIIRQNQRW